MFWRKEKVAVEAAPAGVSSVEAKATKPKAKKLSPKETVMSEIEQLAPEQELKYFLPSTYGSRVYIVELNPEYPKKGKKYVMSTQRVEDGKLVGEKTRSWDSDKPKAIVNWIIDAFLGQTGVPEKWKE